MKPELSIPLVMSAAVLVAAPALAAPRDELIKRNISIRNAPVAGAPDVRIGAGTNLAFPKTWRLVRRTTSTITLREGSRACRYTIRATLRGATGDEPDATAHALAALPATSRFVVDSGVRGSVAWRVIRISERDHVHLEAVGVRPGSSFVTARAGRKLWLETRISARSDRGDECHAGTWRETAGPRIGDALAIAGGRLFVMP
jgi:hypothetical protein